jgi:hypothetical protein
MSELVPNQPEHQQIKGIKERIGNWLGIYVADRELRNDPEFQRLHNAAHGIIEGEVAKTTPGSVTQPNHDNPDVMEKFNRAHGIIPGEVEPDSDGR